MKAKPTSATKPKGKSDKPIKSIKQTDKKLKKVSAKKDLYGDRKKGPQVNHITLKKRLKEITKNSQASTSAASPAKPAGGSEPAGKDDETPQVHLNRRQKQRQARRQIKEERRQTDENKSKYLAASSKSTKIHPLYTSGVTLIVGDGDLSFAASLTTLRRDTHNIISTTYDKYDQVLAKYPATAQRSMDTIHHKQGLIFTGVDATNLSAVFPNMLVPYKFIAHLQAAEKDTYISPFNVPASTESTAASHTTTSTKAVSSDHDDDLPKIPPNLYAMYPFDRVIFNFPHTGEQRVHLNRELLKDFFLSARPHLSLPQELIKPLPQLLSVHHPQATKEPSEFHQRVIDLFEKTRPCVNPPPEPTPAPKKTPAKTGAKGKDKKSKKNHSTATEGSTDTNDRGYYLFPNSKEYIQFLLNNVKTHLLPLVDILQAQHQHKLSSGKPNAQAPMNKAEKRDAFQLNDGGYGRVMVVLRDGPPYNGWDLEIHAANGLFELESKCLFQPEWFKGYQHQTTNTQHKDTQGVSSHLYIFRLSRIGIAFALKEQFHLTLNTDKHTVYDRIALPGRKRKLEENTKTAKRSTATDGDDASDDDEFVDDLLRSVQGDSDDNDDSDSDSDAAKRNSASVASSHAKREAQDQISPEDMDDVTIEDILAQEEGQESLNKAYKEWELGLAHQDGDAQQSSTKRKKADAEAAKTSASRMELFLGADADADETSSQPAKKSKAEQKKANQTADKDSTVVLLQSTLLKNFDVSKILALEKNGADDDESSPSNDTSDANTTDDDDDDSDDAEFDDDHDIDNDDEESGDFEDSDQSDASDEQIESEEDEMSDDDIEIDDGQDDDDITYDETLEQSDGEDELFDDDTMGRLQSFDYHKSDDLGLANEIMAMMTSGFSKSASGKAPKLAPIKPSSAKGSAAVAKPSAKSAPKASTQQKQQKPSPKEQPTSTAAIATGKPPTKKTSVKSSTTAAPPVIPSKQQKTAAKPTPKPVAMTKSKPQIASSDTGLKAKPKGAKEVVASSSKTVKKSKKGE